ncbi:MAG: type I-E CRISPR-associated protein Cse1/CasA [Propionibacteriaceae bacterium]|nr:type I-E CRISPR-associated protein Cse1/CasA [Propionibacteriaceae bacterium]
MSETRSFNLVDEDWIEVKWLDGHASIESLTTTLSHAGQIREIIGDLPTQSFAILRLLLAVLQRAILTAPSFDRREKPVHFWGRLWQENDLPMKDISDYLERWRDRFFLLGGDAPFMQVPDLHTARDEVSTVGKIIAEVPDGHPFFTTRSGAETTALSAPEAARWLVHAHAYDSSGIKSGVVGDPEVKSGKSYPIGTGWSGGIGGIQVEGDCLRSTLLLNLRLAQAENDGRWVSDTDLPAWERPVCGPGDSKRQPTGQVDLYTWQSRRIRLICDGEFVTGVVLTNGDKLKPRNLFALEPMSGWRRSLNQEKLLKEKSPVYLPARLNAARAMWRGLDALLPTDAPTKMNGQDYLCPGIVDWISALTSDESGTALPDDLIVTLRGVGVVYGPQESTFADVVNDRLIIHASLLSAPGVPLVELAKSCVSDAADAVRQIGYLAQNLHLAAGGDSQTTDGPRDRATEVAYYTLDIAFRRWLSALQPTEGGVDSQQDHIHAAREQWRSTARLILRQLGDDLLVQSGPQAFTGHATKDPKTPWMTSGTAARIFSGALRRALPLTTDTPHTSTTGKEHT